MAKRGYVTLTTTYQEIHDGASFCYFICSAAVLMADSASPAATEVVTTVAADKVILPMGKATYAKVASSTAVCYLYR